MVGLIFQNFQGYLLLRQNSTLNGLNELQNTTQRLINEQSKLFGQLDHILSQNDFSDNQLHDSNTQEASSSDNLPAQVNTKSNEIYSVQQTWANYVNEDLDVLDSEIFKEQLRRFEASLTPIGKQELKNRILYMTEQFRTGNVTGFEEVVSNINFDFLTVDIESLTPRELKYRNEILEGFKEMSLMRMHGEYTGNWVPTH